MKRWEYLVVRLERSLLDMSAPAFEEQYWISRPGPELSEFQAPSGWRNQLGAEGWEQVSHVLLENTVGGPLRGWPQVGTPVTQEWTFKRPLDSGGFL